MLFVPALILCIGLINTVTSSCDWVIDHTDVEYDDFGTPVYPPVGIGTCNFRIHEYVGTAFMYTCDSGKVHKHTYEKAFDCTGASNKTDITSTSTYDCSTGAICSDEFGFRTNCACSVANKNCEFGLTYFLVNQICANIPMGNMSVMWEISCGSMATQKVFEEEDCKGNFNTTTWLAGCQTAESETHTSYEMAFSICPSTMATYSIVALFMSFIFALTL